MAIQSTGPSPYLRVTVGAPILTADEQKIGKVKEVRPHGFKVDAGFLQRDYWLPDDLVAEAVPDEMVRLTVSKDEIGAHRLSGEPDKAA